MAGGEGVQQPGGQPGGAAGAQLPGGAAGAAQPGAGDRPGEYLDDGVLAVGEAAAGGGEGTQRVRVVIGLEGRISVRASRSVPPAASARAGNGGAAGAVTAWAPGQAASMARSIMPGGTVPGTHIRIVMTGPAQVYSNPRWGWPCHSRAHRGRSSPVRCPHSASPPAGSASGGASTVITRAFAARAACWRRRSHARPAHCDDQGSGQRRPGRRALVAGGFQQDAGDAGGYRARVGQVPAQRADRGSRTRRAASCPDHHGEAAARHSRPSSPVSLPSPG